MTPSSADDRPLILVTNDDGVEAAGLAVLVEELSQLGRVVVSAPLDQQSAVGHGITLDRPLRVRVVGDDRFAVSGKPADAVVLGVSELCPREPDLVAAGINHGGNLGTDVLYSGTVAAATEAAIRGIPALAVSQLLPRIERQVSQGIGWDPRAAVSPELERCMRRTARFAARVAAALIEAPLEAGTTLNLNGPVAESDRFAWTRLGRWSYVTNVVERIDPRGVPYYFIGGGSRSAEEDPRSDLAAVRSGLFSLTPLRLERSAEDAEIPRWDLGEYSAATE